MTENMLDEEIQKFFRELSRLWDGMPRVTVAGGYGSNPVQPSGML